MVTESLNQYIIKLAPHQLDILYSDAIDIILSGGYGTGKTFDLHLYAIIHCIKYPGTEFLILAKQQSYLKHIYIPDFKKWFGKHGKIPYVRDWSGLEVAELLNGSLIHFNHAWDKEKGVEHLDGYNISGYGIHQVEHVTQYKVYTKLNSRCRNNAALLPNGEIDEHHVFEGNPGGKMHWLYKRAFQGSTVRKVIEHIDLDGKEYDYTEHEKIEIASDGVEDKIYSISIETQNFPWLPKRYKEKRMRGMSDREINRYIKGNWENFSGLRYDIWDRDEHMPDPWPWFKKVYQLPDPYVLVLGIDWGFNNPTACVYALYNRLDDVYYVYRCYYERGKEAQEAAREILVKENRAVMCAYIDTSTANETGMGKVYDCFNEEFRKRQIPLIRARKSSNDTENMFYRLLQLRDDETRGWYVWKCPENNPFVQEIENYAYPEYDEEKEKKNPIEKPVDKDNHLMKAVEYMVSGTYHKSKVKVARIRENQPDSITAFERWQMGLRGDVLIIPPD
jgi:hypothetical protein